MLIMLLLYYHRHFSEKHNNIQMYRYIHLLDIIIIFPLNAILLPLFVDLKTLLWLKIYNELVNKKIARGSPV